MIRVPPTLAFPAGLVVLGLDVITKRIALDTLRHGATEWVLGVIPLTLAFNKGIAFGIPLAGARYGLLPALVVAVLAVLVMLYRRGHAADPYRPLAVALVGAGAVGNLWDRLRWEHGVVDFVGPIDLGFMLWPIFNVADVSVTLGALLLAASFGWEQRQAEQAAAAPEAGITS